MRILHVVPTYFPAVRYGGPIRSVHGLASAMVRLGHEVDVFTTSMDGDQDLKVPTGDPVDLDGVKVSYFRVPALRRLAWSPGLRQRLRKSAAGYSIAHLHSVFLHPTNAAARVAASAGLPYVLSPRGMLMRAAIAGRNPAIKRAWIAMIERRTIAGARGIHVTADLEADELRALGLSLPPVFRVANGVDWPRQWEPLAAGPFRDLPQPYALFMSRINWKKGLDRLVAAWQGVGDLNLVVAGNDEEGYEAKIRALAIERGVAHRIHFVGPASDRDKWALYASAQMFILPSYAENFGNVVVEAMAMRCPVVVSRAVGAAQLVLDAGAGLVNEGDPAELARDVNLLAGNSELRAAMGQLGHGFAAAHLSWEAVATEMVREYERLTGRASAVAA